MKKKHFYKDPKEGAEEAPAAEATTTEKGSEGTGSESGADDKEQE